MRIVPEDARYAMSVIREGRSLEQYIDTVWQRRVFEAPPVERPHWRWPLARLEHSNVTPMRRKKP